jgi:Cdc6-like AAA superfamily ATPase
MVHEAKNERSSLHRDPVPKGEGETSSRPLSEGDVKSALSPQGQVVIVSGPSGVGKTTVMHRVFQECISHDSIASTGGS